MNNSDKTKCEITEIEGKIDALIDAMIAKYGKFISPYDQTLDSKQLKLANQYKELINKKDSLISSLNDSAY